MAQSSDKFILRQFLPSDYEEYASWWHPDNPPAPEDLPKIGLVVGNMKAVGFLANTDCSFGVITFWMEHPANKPRETKEALELLFKALIESSIIMGKKKIFLYTKIRSIIRLLESLHFINHDGHLIRNN